MNFRHKLLLFGLAVAALTAVAVFIAGGTLIRRSVSDRVKERLQSEVLLLADWLAHEPGVLPDSQPSPSAPTTDASAQSDAIPLHPSSTPSASVPAPAAGGIGGVIEAPPDLALAYERCDAFADRAGKSLGLRVTVIGADGTVLGDSALNGADLVREENHAGRPEVQMAQRSGSGTSVRSSATVHDELFYVARRINRRGALAGYVRLAIPVHEIQRVTGRYSATLALMSFLILIVVSAIGYAAVRRFSHPVEEMSRTADAIAAGRHDLEVEYESDDEIGRLGAAFNRMTRSLAEQIRELSREKKLRDTILGGMKEGILVLDRDRRVLLANDSLRAILGLRGQDPTGRPLIQVVRNPVVIEAFDAALRHGEESRAAVAAGAGSDRSFEITAAPLTSPAGAQVGAIGLFFDVTRLSALESVRRDFVADASHELRSPLTSVKAFVETLLAGGLEDGTNNRRFLEIIKKHSDRMEAILDDLTDLSRIETGAVDLEIERFDLAALARDLIESLRPKAASRSVSVESEVPAATIVSADRRRVEQILLNLLDNAIKFNRPGGSVVIRSPAAANDAGIAGVVRVVVEDTGIGIPAESLEKVFHRFYQVDRARSRDMGGTGLGLSIVKHLMRLHGGTVRLESEPGRGSRFILEFPDVAA